MLRLLAWTISLSIALGHSARAGEACGGYQGTVCAEGLTCELPAGKCKVADLTGDCVPTPEICTEQRDPVCDCRGVTHDNLCKLLKAGAQLDHRGECKKS
jgi:hypothetical protein